MGLQPLGPAVPRRHNAAMRVLGCVVLRAMRWRLEGVLPDLPKFVVAVAPHTSNWDFVVGAAALFALELRIAFLGKHTLFRWPFGAVLRWMGGIPVDRAAPHGVVGDAIAAFSQVERRVLAIAPQGTRSTALRFKSGFLHIASGAHVPVVLVAFDYAARVVRFGPAFMPGGDVDADRARSEAHFAQVRGRNA